MPHSQVYLWRPAPKDLFLPSKPELKSSTAFKTVLQRPRIPRKSLQEIFYSSHNNMIVLLCIHFSVLSCWLAMNGELSAVAVIERCLYIYGSFGFSLLRSVWILGTVSDWLLLAPLPQDFILDFCWWMGAPLRPLQNFKGLRCLHIAHENMACLSSDFWLIPLLPISWRESYPKLIGFALPPPKKELFGPL